MKSCKICETKFEPKMSFQNTCSQICRLENQRQLSKAQAKRKKTQIVKKKCRQCGKEVISTAYCPQSFCGGKYGECFRVFMSKSRKGKKNPAYRNGHAIQGKRTYTGKHLRACSKYRKWFFEKYGYLFCEHCKVNANGTPKFEVHHIYYASLYPKHKELHNPKNLILLCIRCHNDFHSSKNKEDFLKLEKERELKKLFA